MQDVIPPKKRKSIRDIPLPDGKSNVEGNQESYRQENNFSQREKERSPRYQTPQEELIENDIPETYEDEYEEEPVVIRKTRKRKSKPSRAKIISLSVLVLIFITTILIISREGAKVFVYAKELTQTTNISIELPYTPTEVSLEKTVSLQATGEEEVVEKAKGKIVIYNEYEETEQRLLQNTRFESPDGLIYRIPSSVVVPGLTRDEKGNVVPGKLEVDVVADEAGEKYNIGPVRFSVPGFEGLPQYESFYAKSENPIEGGFDGIRKVVSDSDRQEAESELKNQLRTELISTAQSQSDESKLTLANESMIVYEILGDKVNGNDVSISARGKINAVTFDLEEFSNAIAKSTVTGFSEEEDVSIKNINDLKISVSKNEDKNTANLEVSGSVEFLWENDPEMIKKTIAGTNKNSLKETVNAFPGITKISSEVKPFWKKTFPEDISKIKIIDSKN